jgi:uroporphyrinogen-III synthase
MAEHQYKEKCSGILLTRPIHQNRALIELFKKENALIYELPTIAIKPLTLPRIADKSFIAQSTRFIFISSNAVKYGWPVIQSHIKPHATLYTIGQASAKELMALSQMPVIYPEDNTDSEALLSLPGWQEIKEEKIIICRGVGGREWLKEELERRGAQVEYLECYIRALPEVNLAILDNAITSQAVILIMSKESLTNLWQLAGEEKIDALKKMSFLVCHERVRDYAKNLGIETIYLTDNNDQAILNTWRRITN